MSWMSKKQPIVTLSSKEAEFVATARCACQVIWMKRVLRFLINSHSSTRIICGNSSTIKLSKLQLCMEEENILECAFISYRIL